MQQQLRDQLIKQARLAAITPSGHSAAAAAAGSRVMTSHATPTTSPTRPKSHQRHNPVAPPPPAEPPSPRRRRRPVAGSSVDAGARASFHSSITVHIRSECTISTSHHIEQSLALSATDLQGLTHQRGTELAKALLDRAFRRLPDDIRTYLRAVEALTCDGCALCEEEAREARSPTSARRGPRFKS
jgi:hypothetical protein